MTADVIAVRASFQYSLAQLVDPNMNALGWLIAVVLASETLFKESIREKAREALTRIPPWVELPLKSFLFAVEQLVERSRDWLVALICKKSQHLSIFFKLLAGTWIPLTEGCLDAFWPPLAWSETEAVYFAQSAMQMGLETWKTMTASHAHRPHVTQPPASAQTSSGSSTQLPSLADFRAMVGQHSVENQQARLAKPMGSMSAEVQVRPGDAPAPTSNTQSMPYLRAVSTPPSPAPTPVLMPSACVTCSLTLVCLLSVSKSNTNARVQRACDLGTTDGPSGCSACLAAGHRCHKWQVVQPSVIQMIFGGTARMKDRQVMANELLKRAQAERIIPPHKATTGSEAIIRHDNQSAVAGGANGTSVSATGNETAQQPPKPAIGASNPPQRKTTNTTVADGSDSESADRQSLSGEHKVSDAQKRSLRSQASVRAQNAATPAGPTASTSSNNKDGRASLSQQDGRNPSPVSTEVQTVEIIPVRPTSSVAAPGHKFKPSRNEVKAFVATTSIRPGQRKSRKAIPAKSSQAEEIDTTSEEDQPVKAPSKLVTTAAKRVVRADSHDSSGSRRGRTSKASVDPASRAGSTAPAALRRDNQDEGPSASQPFT